MNKDLLDTLVRNLLGPVIAAILGAIGIWLRQWYQTRDARYKVQQGRAEMAERIDLIEKWLRVKQQICSPEEFGDVKRTASLQLEQIYSAMFEAPVSVSIAEKPYSERIRRALLLYWPASIGGFITHFVFYLLMVMALFTSAIPFVDVGKETRPVLILGVIFLLSFILIPAALMRALALRLDKKNRPTLPTQ